MSLSSTAKYLIAIVLVAWIGVLALLMGMRPTGAETRFDTAGALEQAVAQVSASGPGIVGRISRDDIDLCTVPLGQYIDARAMLPLGKTEDGGWALLN